MAQARGAGSNLQHKTSRFSQAPTVCSRGPDLGRSCRCFCTNASSQIAHLSYGLLVHRKHAKKYMDFAAIALYQGPRHLYRAMSAETSAVQYTCCTMGPEACKGPYEQQKKLSLCSSHARRGRTTRAVAPESARGRGHQSNSPSWTPQILLATWRCWGLSLPRNWDAYSSSSPTQAASNAQMPEPTSYIQLENHPAPHPLPSARSSLRPDRTRLAPRHVVYKQRESCPPHQLGR